MRACGSFLPAPSMRPSTRAGFPNTNGSATPACEAIDAVLSTEDLVSGECYFVASGITDGQLLRGVRYGPGGATTHSLVMRSRSGTIRTIEAQHQFHKLNTYGHLDFVHPASDR